MSELRVFEEARAKLATKRRELAGIMTSGDNLGELSVGFLSIHHAIGAIDEVLRGEGYLVPTDATKTERR
jgi:formate dehydrogenase assembly factor FdhD